MPRSATLAYNFTMSAENAASPLAQLADHLAERREFIIRAWAAATRRDPEVTAARRLSAVEFADHVPGVLDAFERRLRAVHSSQRTEALADQGASAADHGLQRWQQGYDQREVIREWNALTNCLVEEVAEFTARNPAISSVDMSNAWRALNQLAIDGVCESVEGYARLHRSEAAGRQAVLEHAIDQLSELDRQRTDAWREAAHDMRGSLGLVQHVAALLHQEGLPRTTVTESIAILDRGTSALLAILEDLSLQARLDAGHEERRISAFDTAALLLELCEDLQPMARSRSLVLEALGPPRLEVRGDPVKVRRSCQNLLLNALKYTQRGGVRIGWRVIDDTRWSLTVQDTGPGLHEDDANTLVGALDVATEENLAMEFQAQQSGAPEADPSPLPTLQSQSDHAGSPAHGEGLGLPIVKRLCELLNAKLEMKSAPGEGTTFRITFPRDYAGE